MKKNNNKNDYIIYGIQGGVRSFNEQAINYYLKKNRIRNHKIKYLFTTSKVLSSLDSGKIDFGLFAIENSVGGLVEESIYAMADYKNLSLRSRTFFSALARKIKKDYFLFFARSLENKIRIKSSLSALARKTKKDYFLLFARSLENKFKIVEKFSILIRHFLMKKSEIEFQDIKTIMAHPQVLKQCQSTLKKKYPGLLLASGKGDLIDTAEAAKALSAGKISSDIAILGPENLSALYNLEIIDKDLQDNKNNLTGFLLVKNRE